ncbi:MAG TPA: hypothetical protein VF262_10790, partial [Burkholderiales bacterium]
MEWIRRNFSASSVISFLDCCGIIVRQSDTISKSAQAARRCESFGGGAIEPIATGALLRVEDVGVRFGGIVALDGV